MDKILSSLLILASCCAVATSTVIENYEPKNDRISTAVSFLDDVIGQPGIVKEAGQVFRQESFIPTRCHPPDVLVCAIAGGRFPEGSAGLFDSVPAFLMDVMFTMVMILPTAGIPAANSFRE